MEQTQEKLNKILRNCDTCKAKMCSLCSNSKVKRSLKLKLKDLKGCSSLNESKIDKIIQKIKNFFKIEKV